MLLPAPGGSVPQERDAAGPCRPPDAPARLARRLRGELDQRQPDRPRPVHALQCLHRRSARSRRSTSATRSTSRRCTGHRDCVRVCEAAGAIDFQRAAAGRDRALRPRARPRRRRRSSRCTSRRRATSMPADDAGADRRGARAARDASASSRSRSSSTTSRRSAPTAATSRSAATPASTSARPQAIRSDASLKGRTSGGGIVVEPHLCVGCGACTTVCPSGALSYATPRPEELGRRIRTLLATYARAGGRDAALLIHSQGAGARGRRRARPRGAHRRGGARRAGARAAARGLAHRLGRHRPVAVGDRLRRGPGLGADDRRGGARLPARGRRADGGGAGDPHRARLRHGHFAIVDAKDVAVDAAAARACGRRSPSCRARRRPIRRSPPSTGRWRRRRRRRPPAATFSVQADKRDDARPGARPPAAVGGERPRRDRAAGRRPARSAT